MLSIVVDNQCVCLSSNNILKMIVVSISRPSQLENFSFGLGLGLESCGLGLCLEGSGLVNIPGSLEVLQ